MTRQRTAAGEFSVGQGTTGSTEMDPSCRAARSRPANAAVVSCVCDSVPSDTWPVEGVR